MKRLLLLTSSLLFCLAIPSFIFSLPPDDLEAFEEEVEEEELHDEELAFEEDAEFEGEIEEAYVVVGADGAIALDEIPSIIDDGGYVTEMAFPSMDLEEHDVGLVEFE